MLGYLVVISEAQLIAAKATAGYTSDGSVVSGMLFSALVSNFINSGTRNETKPIRPITLPKITNVRLIPI